MEPKFKVIDWPTTGAHKWLVAVTGADGSYTPIRELNPDKNEYLPTWENQLYQAAKLLADGGKQALNNPHAMIGRTCKCRDCFCCAAAEILRDAEVL